MEIERPYYMNQLLRRQNNGRIKIITGIRRCGKSYLLFHLFRNYLISQGVEKDRIIELALDELANARLRNPFELDAWIRKQIRPYSGKYYIFIDEIQFSTEEKNPYVSEGTVTFVDALLGLMKIPGVDIYVTGSNSRMLSTDILTQFRDRGDEIHLNPLTFSEFYEATPDKLHALRDYSTFGGMPYLLSLTTPEEKSDYLKSLFRETYIRDVVERNHLKNDEEVLDILLDFISSAIGSFTNPAKLENRFRSEQKISVSHTTIAQYLKYFEESYLIRSARRFDVKGSRYFSTPLKYYFTDIGLRNARLNFRQVEQTHIMENMIFNELTAAGYNVDIGVVPVRQRDPDNPDIRRSRQLEIDFIVNRGTGRCYIQSALNMDSREKQEQEIASLRNVNDSFRKIVILGNDILPWHDENGIFYVGFQDFLLKGLSGI